MESALLYSTESNFCAQNIRIYARWQISRLFEKTRHTVFSRQLVNFDRIISRSVQPKQEKTWIFHDENSRSNSALDSAEAAQFKISSYTGLYKSNWFAEYVLQLAHWFQCRCAQISAPMFGNISRRTMLNASIQDHADNSVLKEECLSASTIRLCTIKS